MSSDARAIEDTGAPSDHGWGPLHRRNRLRRAGVPPWTTRGPGNPSASPTENPLTRRDSGPSTPLTTLLLLWLFAGATSAHAQEPVWNGTSVMDLVERARVERHSAVVDTAFRAYQADARGYVYFFFDRPDSGERTLVKADQIALQVFWQAPDKTRQRIVGLRDKKVLPTNIHYHLDHLTVVQDDFGDRIRIGDGDEVSDVLHPLAPGADSAYDYRLADSLSIRYGGGTEEVKVYEIRVRPRDPGAPGYIGSIFLDRTTAAIVRMSFTFTPSSYVDPYLDYIRISLDNALWMGRHWLPYRQEVELRREIPQLDFLVGSIIRGRFEIGPYVFNPQLPPQLFAGRGVTAAPEPDRRAFPFERGLFDDLEQDGLAPTPSLEEIRAEARRIVTDRALSGLAPVRLYFHSFSDGLRYDRAEGVFAGAGIDLRPLPSVQMRTSGGYAFGREKPSGSVTLQGAPARVVPVLEAYWDRLGDLGPFEAAAPLIRSLGATFASQDWLDPWFARGARLTLRGSRPGAGPSVAFRWERQASASDVLAGRGFPPVRPISEGNLAAIDARAPFPLPGAGSGSLDLTLARLGARTFASAVLRDRWTLDRPGDAWSVRADVSAGAATAETPVQELFLLGGRGTLPGFPFREFVGRGFWLARVEGTHPLLQPWVGIRATAALGATTFASASLPDGWEGAHDSGGVRASVGAGVSLGWDVIRLDVARGLGPGGLWEVIFSVDPRFRPWL